jgi:hypothetical protein
MSAFTDEIQQRIASILIDVALRNRCTATDRMDVKPVLPAVSKDWRSGLRERAQERPTNQACRERTAPNHPVEDGLALGSRQEHQVYQVLNQIQATTPSDRTIAIAPLPGVRLQAATPGHQTSSCSGTDGQSSSKWTGLASCVCCDSSCQ